MRYGITQGAIGTVSFLPPFRMTVILFVFKFKSGRSLLATSETRNPLPSINALMAMSRSLSRLKKERPLGFSKSAYF